MKFIREIKSCDKVLERGRMVYAEVICEEYATVWSFYLKFAGDALFSAYDWRYKKSGLNRSYENAKSEFIHEVEKRYNTNSPMTWHGAYK